MTWPVLIGNFVTEWSNRWPNTEARFRTFLVPWSNPYIRSSTLREMSENLTGTPKVCSHGVEGECERLTSVGLPVLY